MIQLIFQDGPIKYKRVSKSTAKKLWAAGKIIIACPHKLRPFGPWRPSMILSTKTDKDFNAVVGEFEYYNCGLHETGYYASFYTPVD